MKIDRSLLSGSISLMVLSLLAERDQYGYQIISELARRSDNTFALKEGTLYPVLHTLENDKRVISYTREAENGRVRKYYRITNYDLELLSQKTEEWLRFSEKVNQVVLGPTASMA